MYDFTDVYVRKGSGMLVRSDNLIKIFVFFLTIHNLFEKKVMFCLLIKKNALPLQP